jgi:radical SAM protein with 4Fe4S-binding SPASM domain
MISLYAWLAQWDNKVFLQWLFKLNNLVQAGSGARQICCFGLNPHVVWEMTNECNLKCIHCHTSGGETSSDELTQEEGRALINQVASLDIRTFVFSGGEPLLREDLFDLIAYARWKRLNVFVATNGTLITKQTAKLLRKYNVGAVIGLDGMNPEIHDSVRGAKGVFDEVVEGINNCVSENIYLHLNIFVSKLNFNEVERIIDYGNGRGVFSYFIYNFVPMGRGEKIKNQSLEGDDFKALLDLILHKQHQAKSIIIPVASPEYWAYMLQKRNIHDEKVINFLSRFLGGCLAGKGFMYIKPNGDVWACPFIPVSTGNVRREEIHDIYENLQKVPLSCAKHNTDCKNCKYEPICGGCKTRIDSKERCLFYQAT